MKRIIPLLAALALTQCGVDQPAPPVSQAPLNPATDFRPVTGEPGADDIARFLAGRPVRSGRQLSDIQRTDVPYQVHALTFDRLWRKFASVRRTRQTDFHERSVRPHIGASSTIVYPFGGPDALHVTSMFPSARTYVLIGLEAVGTVPTQEELSGDLLERLGVVMDEPLRHGYFITEEMRRAPAATPIIMASLALAGAEVTQVTPVSAGGSQAVEFRFRTAGGQSKQLVYVSTDLSNGGFGGGFRSWLDQFSGSTAYFKAASYLMHDDAFSQIREWVLGNSRAIVQDDSGIPYRHFDPSQWNAKLLGNYDAPIPLFAQWKQDDLAAAYDAAGPGTEIPFGSGYHLKTREANLQLWRRK